MIWLGLVSNTGLLFLMLGGVRFPRTYVLWKGFRLYIVGTQQLFYSSHVRERGEALLRGTLVGGVRHGLLLGRVRGQPVPCRCCGGTDGDGHLFQGVYLSSSF